MSMHLGGSSNPNLILRGAARRADLLVLGILALGLAVAIAMGTWYGPLGTGVLVGGGIMVTGVLAFLLAPATVWSRCILALCGMLMVGLHIQLSAGMIEAHFGVFVFLAFLLIYRDWRPILVGAATIAAHHVVFDHLQNMGLPVYCLSAPSFLMVVVHALYVIVQTGVEIFIAYRLAQDARIAAELESLCQVDSSGQLQLHVEGIHAETAPGRLVKNALVRLMNVVQEVHQTSDTVALASSDLSRETHDLGSRTQQVANNVQLAAQAMAVLDEASTETAKEVQSALTLAHRTSTTATDCGALVHDVSQTMNEIRQGARKIADLVTTIDNFAFQTNLLALNAAVEAARAGPHGRGFAVVATEVRTLAQQSAEAARAIRALTHNSLNATDHGAETVQRATASMNALLSLSQQVCARMQATSEHVREQSAEIQAAASSVQAIDQMTQANAVMVAQSSQATALLAQQAHRLMNVASEVARRATPPAPAAPNLSKRTPQTRRRGASQLAATAA